MPFCNHSGVESSKVSTASTPKYKARKIGMKFDNPCNKLPECTARGILTFPFSKDDSTPLTIKVDPVFAKTSKNDPIKAAGTAIVSEVCASEPVVIAKAVPIIVPIV